MANSLRWNGHVLRREDGYVLRREDGYVLRRALHFEAEEDIDKNRLQKKVRRLT